MHAVYKVVKEYSNHHALTTMSGFTDVIVMSVFKWTLLVK